MITEVQTSGGVAFLLASTVSFGFHVDCFLKSGEKVEGNAKWSWSAFQSSNFTLLGPRPLGF